MKLFGIIFSLLLIFLQCQLWVSHHGVSEVWRLHHGIKTQQHENTALIERNTILANEVTDLKSGQQALEERARNDLGMIKSGERYIEIV